MDSQLFADEHFEKFIETLNLKGITQFDYFVNWGKVFKNITPKKLVDIDEGKSSKESSALGSLGLKPKPAI